MPYLSKLIKLTSDTLTVLSTMESRCIVTCLHVESFEMFVHTESFDKKLLNIAVKGRFDIVLIETDRN